jgi:hypothetical protein
MCPFLTSSQDTTIPFLHPVNMLFPTLPIPLAFFLPESFLFVLTAGSYVSDLILLTLVPHLLN